MQADTQSEALPLTVFSMHFRRSGEKWPGRRYGPLDEQLKHEPSVLGLQRQSDESVATARSTISQATAKMMRRIRTAQQERILVSMQ